jgi:aspartate racemase
MHRMADAVSQSISIPLLHIADATAEQVIARGFKQIGLLGTRFTMEEDFYRGRLENKFGLEVLVPEQTGRDLVHRVIYEELVVGKIDPESKKAYQQVIQQLSERGAQGVILGCTEIGLLVKQADSPLPLFDTTAIHAQAAVDYALQGNS